MHLPRWQWTFIIHNQKKSGFITFRVYFGEEEEFYKIEIRHIYSFTTPDRKKMFSLQHFHNNENA